MLGLSGRHWLTFKWVNGAYYVIYDSQKEAPEIICSTEKAEEIINGWLKDDGQLFQVYKGLHKKTEILE